MDRPPPREGRFKGLEEGVLKEETRRNPVPKKRKKKREEAESGEDTEDNATTEVAEEEERRSLRSRFSQKVKSLVKKEPEQEAKTEEESVSEDTREESEPVIPEIEDNMPDTRAIKFEDLTGREVSIEEQFILCLGCHTKKRYTIKGKLEKVEGEKPKFVADGLTLFGVTVDPTIAIGVFQPMKRNGLDKDIEKWLLDTHITDPVNSCLEAGNMLTTMVIRKAKADIEKYNKSMDGDDDRNKRFYAVKDGYIKFTTNMKAREIKTKLANARATISDGRWRWTDSMKLEMLTKEMSNDLRLKIQSDTGKDPQDNTTWSYDELEKAIQKQAVTPVDQAKLAREMHTVTRGKNIDDTNGKIEDWLEELDCASKTQGEKSDRINETVRKNEEERFANPTTRDSIKYLLLRSSLSIEIAKQVRAHEIVSNEGLGLNNSKLITFVRQLEKNKEEASEEVNKVEFKRIDGITKDEFHEKRKKLLNGCCPQCGQKSQTKSHPTRSCKIHVKCDECGRASHMTRFCVRRAKNREGRAYAMDYDGPSDDSDDEEAVKTLEAYGWSHSDEEHSDEDDEETLYAAHFNDTNDDEDTSEEEEEVKMVNTHSDSEDTSEAEEEEYTAHKVILRASSQFFENTESEDENVKEEKRKKRKTKKKKKSEEEATYSEDSNDEEEDENVTKKKDEAINNNNKESEKIEKNITVKWIYISHEETDEYTYEEDADDIAWKLSEPGEIITVD